jgi:hypothetical protein
VKVEVGYTGGEKGDFKWGIEAGHLPNRLLTSEDLNLIKSNGIDWIAIDFIWRRIEPKEFDFTYYDRVVNEANKAGLKVLGRLGNGYSSVGEERNLIPDWTSIDNPNYPEELSKYIYATVSHFKGIGYWVVENEANLALGHTIMGWRKGNWNEEKIRVILEKGCKAVRKADSGTKIVISVSTPVPGWIDYLDKVTNKWKIDYDVVGLQDYPFGILEFGVLTPLTKHIHLNPLKNRVISSMKHECEVARKFKPEVMFTELGFHTTYNQDERQVEALKYELKGAIEGKANGIFWFAYKDDPTDFPKQERHFGLIKTDGTPKPAWHEYGKIIKNPAILDEIQYAETSTRTDFLNSWFIIKIWNTMLKIGEACPGIADRLIEK